MMEMITIFFIISILVVVIALRDPSVFLVVTIGSFFPYYFSMQVFNVKLYEGGTVYIHASFLLALFAYTAIREKPILSRKPVFTINTLDKFYISYYFLWLIVFFINLDTSLFIFKSYLQAPYWLTITFILPIILKPIYNRINISNFIRYLEWFGYFAASAIFVCLLLKVTSKETLAEYEIANLSDAFQYTPFRGFFSTRQARLLSIPIIIFVSRYITNKLSNKEMLIRIPFIILCFFGIIISGSRATFILLCLLCFYLIISASSFTRKITISIIIAIVSMVLLAGYFYMPSYTHLFSRIFNPDSYCLEVGGIGDRLEVYLTGIRNFLQYPLIGNGMSRMHESYRYSHSSVISSLEDTGLLGFAILSLMVIHIFRKCKWKYNKKQITSDQFIIRNIVILFFLYSNLYGTIIGCSTLFLLVYIYYFNYRKNHCSTISSIT